MAKTGRSADLDPLERLEEKVRLLVTLVGRQRADQARAAEERARIVNELEAARTRLADVEGAAAELAALREEREAVRCRVSSLLEQIEELNL
jgi:hypothetical protein